MTIDQLNQLDAPEFVESLGGIYEHSPWVAEAALKSRPFENTPALIESMRSIVDLASDKQKFELLRSHPDLAGKLALEDRLSSDSKSEQAGLGLDRLSADEFRKLSRLNEDYHEKFGIPFIVCVRLLNGIPELLDVFEQRISQKPNEEHSMALQQVHAIAELRLQDLLNP